MLEVSDEAKDAKLASRIPLMQTAAALGSLGTPAAHAPVMNELIAKSSQALGATIQLEETRRDKHQARVMMLLLKEQCHAKLMARLEKVQVVAVFIDESQDVAMKG